MMWIMLLLLLLWAPPGWSAATAPTGPTPVDIRVHPTPVRTVTVASGDATDLQTKLDDAQFGDRIVLPVATYARESFALKVPTGTLANGTNENYVTVVSANEALLPAAGRRIVRDDLANMPRLQTTTATGELLNESVDAVHHYRFVGIYFSGEGVVPTAGSGLGALVGISPFTIETFGYKTAANFPHHFVFERCAFIADYDQGANRLINYEGSHFKVVDSWFQNAHQLANEEAKAIASTYGAGPFLIENNYLEGGSGETVFFGENFSSSPTIVAGLQYQGPSDITVRRNYFYVPLSKYYVHPTYLSPARYVGNGGTITSVGTKVTFSASQDFPGGTGGAQLTHGPYIKNMVTGQVVKLIQGVVPGTVFTSSPAFYPPAVAAAWQTNNTTDGNKVIARKNSYEHKHANRALLEQNIFKNGFESSDQEATVQISSRGIGNSQDIEIRWNYWHNHPVAMMLYLGDTNQCCVSTQAQSRVWVHNNGFIDTGIYALQHGLALSGSGLVLQTNGGPVGSVTTPGDIAAGSTSTGAGITFTSAGNQFLPYNLGNELWLGDDTTPTTVLGKATITDIALWPASVVATVTDAFPDTAGHSYETDGTTWFIGTAAQVTTRRSVDSWVVEHNTFAGPNNGYLRAIAMTSGESIRSRPITPTTNLVIRNNIFDAGANGHPITGDTTLGGLNGLVGADQVFPVWATTPTFQKNVFYGPISGGTVALFSTVGGGYGATGNTTAFSTPDETGSTNSSGSVGFTNHDGGDYSLTSASQYKRWATDGTDPGVDWNVLMQKIAGVAEGLPEVAPASGRGFGRMRGIY